MPQYQKPKALKLHQEAMELYERAASVSEPERSDLMEQAAEKIREADHAENGY